MSQDRDPTKIIGQDNFFRYVPRKGIVLRVEPKSAPLDVLRSAAAALTIGASVEISVPAQVAEPNCLEFVPLLRTTEESEAEFLERVKNGKFQRIRLVQHASQALMKAAAASATHFIDAPVLANGRLELLHYLREVSLSIDYHRYGNLGLRENEERKPLI